MDETKLLVEITTEPDNGGNNDINVIDCSDQTSNNTVSDNLNNDKDSDTINTEIVTNYTSIQFIPTCDMYDKYLDTIRVLTLPHVGQQWISYGNIKEFCGPIVTVKCYENNTIVKDILRNGSYNNTIHQQNSNLQNSKKVLFIDGGGSNYCSLVGDQLVQAAIDSQLWSGIIVYGYVRDVHILQTLPIGIIALGCTPRKSNPTASTCSGQVNIPICINNISINPINNDIAFVDLDGIIIIRYNQIIF